MIKEYLQEGFILKSKGQFKHAVEAFYKALEFDNLSCELMAELAECYYLMKDEERALNYIEQALKINPTHIYTLKLLQTIFINNNKLAEAEQTAKNIYCISQSTHDLAIVFNLLNRQEKFSEIFEYNQVENNTETYYEKAYAKLHLNDLESAENYINQAVNNDSDDKKILLKGQILFKRNKYCECSELVKQIDINNPNPEMLNFVGQVKKYECDFIDAANYFKAALKLDANNDVYCYNCASTYFKMGDVQQAKKYYNLAISIKPDNQNYHFALANLYYSEKNYKRALEELKYDFFEAKLLKAIILYDSGYIILAKKDFKNLLEEQPNNEIIKNYLSKIEQEITL